MSAKTAITKAPAGQLRVEEACAALAKCRTIDEAKGIRDKAEAIKAYLRTQHASLTAQNDAAEIKLRAERRLGELLAEQKAKGERAAKTTNLKRGPKLQRATSEENPPTLKQLGIEKTAASRWQGLAQIPEARFESYVKEQRATPQGEITSAGIRSEHKASEKKAKHVAQVAEVKAYVPPAGKFGIVVFDYPWKFDDARDGSEKSRSGADYPKMTLEEICAFPLPVAKDCLLACWIPNALLIDGTWERIRLSLWERYGAKPKQMRTWTKTGIDGGDVTGLGKAFRNDTEQLILLERGTVTYVETGAEHEVPILRTSFDAPRGRGSEKPALAYEQLAAICPMRPCIDVFARDPRPGWVASGSELTSEPAPDVVPVPPAPKDPHRRSGRKLLRWVTHRDGSQIANGRDHAWRVERSMVGVQIYVGGEARTEIYDTPELAKAVCEAEEAGEPRNSELASRLVEPAPAKPPPRAPKFTPIEKYERSGT